MKKILICAAIIALFCSANLYASGCKVVAVKQTVVTPVVSYLVPIYSFQYVPAPQIAPVIPQPGIPTPAVDQSSAVSDKDKIKELAKALLEEMSKESAGNNTGEGANDDEGPPVVVLPQGFQQ